MSLDLVENRIREQQISVRYSFDRSAAAVVDLNGEIPVNPDLTDSPATKIFRKNFFGDRLTVTLGPVIMSHDRRYFHKRAQFRNRPGYHNLLEDPGGQLILQPHETISISSNERITLGGRIGAYIIPRLRNADAGLFYIPSYIDPYWDGILQGVIVNLSDKCQSLSVCEGIAICRFYEVAGKVSETLKEAFPLKSHHFGQTWPKILHEDAEPFPRRKLPVSGEGATLRSLGLFWAEHKTLIMWALGALGLGGTVLGGMFKYVQISKQLDELSTLPALRTSIGALEAQRVKSGTARIQIPPNQTLTTHQFEVAAAAAVTWSLWVYTENNANVLRVAGHVQKSPTASDRVTVELELTMPQHASRQMVSVQWLLAPQ